jgi:dTDP-4-amino-4,6-dideoxygalactose transaminase
MIRENGNGITLPGNVENHFATVRPLSIPGDVKLDRGGNMSGTAKIAFLDLVTPHRELEEELVSVYRAVLRAADFVGGSMVQEFEHGFAQFCGSEHCIGVGSGTDALRFALIAAGVRAGDTVVTVPNTFIATTEAISQAGARPEFVDVDERTFNMDSEKLRSFLENQCYFDRQTRQLFSRRTSGPVTAIVPVHLFGQMADMDPILELAERYELMVIEDACQAHGAQYFSKKQNRWIAAGSMGRAAAFSFYPGKNLGACGEAGAITTNDEGIARTARMLRDHGQSQKYYHDIEGYNGRLDTLQAGILTVKIKHLEEWNEERREKASQYQRLLGGIAGTIILPYEPPWSKAVYHLYVIRSHNRDALRTHLAQAGIGTGTHYPVPLHLQNAYRALAHKEGDFPVTEKVASEILSIPMYPQLQLEQQYQVAEAVLNFAGTEAMSQRPLGLATSSIRELEEARPSVS